MLLPAAISAAASYVTFAAFIGTDPILPVAGQPPFNLVDIGGAEAVGLVCGVLARVFVAIIRRSKQMAEQVSAWVRSVERRVGQECVRTCRSRWSSKH